ncbi:mesoderm posterior protein 2-like [Alosa sapidissima]|uniref:mesoderm posterior protein 2-like n=1 Tax=Alosa sapidissima TaxID=34773 RepID=UPI001C0A52CF|nr:mesoderm posterior protein 2-like [Alosa sapidissima]
MDASTAELSHTRAEVTSPLFGAFGSSGGGSWSLPRSDSWNYLPLEGDPWSYSASDPEFSNVSSPETISPSSVMDFFSPPGSAAAAHSAQSPSPSPVTTSSSSCEESGCSGNGAGQRSKRKLRSRNPSRQRQSASEKEKLRMRDLTKALHHLRTYLPPSVAPAGQTLTKIQTLRLAIRYIAHLSAQVQVGHVDMGVRMERGMEARQSPAQAHGQAYPQVDSPAQHIQYSQHQSTNHWSHQRDQYTHRFEQYALIQQSQQTITNCQTSALQQDMISYQKENLVQLSHGF